jgi:hypothetical protein
MDLPGLRHFRDGFIYSDPVEALVGEAWVTAVLCLEPSGDMHWATPDMAKLSPVTEWRYATEAGQVAGCNLGEHPQGNQGGQTTKASRSNRVRKGRQKTQA